MSDAPFPPDMRAALDGFAPPPLPADFAERTLAKAHGRASTPPLPRISRRWRAASPWRRAGLIVGGVASLSLVSAAAAATGVFGEPVQVPVISRIAQSLEIVPRPVVRAARMQAEPAPTVAEAPPEASTRERLDAVLDDPEFRRLPPMQRRVELRRTARELIDSGEATPRDVVAALRDTTRERIEALPPEQRRRLGQAVMRNRQERREAIAEGRRPPPPLPPAIARPLVRERLAELRERRQQRLQDLESAESSTPAAPIEPAAPESEGSGGELR